MVRYYDLSDYRIIETNKVGHRIGVYINPTEQEKWMLIDQYKIDEHTLNSALDPDELAV